MLACSNNLLWENNPLFEKPLFRKITIQWASSQGHGILDGHATRDMACLCSYSQGHDNPHEEAAMAKARSQDQDNTHRQATKAKAALMGILLRHVGLPK